MRSLVVVLATFAVALLGCPPAAEKKAPPAGCQKLGDNCEVSPGKLGTCVQKDDCHDASCFVCQSQH